MGKLPFTKEDYKKSLDSKLSNQGGTLVDKLKIAAQKLKVK